MSDVKECSKFQCASDRYVLKQSLESIHQIHAMVSANP